MSKKKEPLQIINVGLISFYESVKSQNVKAVHVDWRPSAQGNDEMIKMIDYIREKQNQ